MSVDNLCSSKIAQKVLENPRKIRSIAQNWSVDLFLSVLNDFSGKKNFRIFPQIFAPIIDFLVKISEKS